MMGEIPINRLYLYERVFFKNGRPVLQGITFPLKVNSFASGIVRLPAGAEKLGAPRRAMDVRNISYALADPLAPAD